MSNSTYTGKTAVGQPAQTRELPGLAVTKMAVGPMDNDSYLLRCTETGAQLLIDAANDAATLLDAIGDAGLATVVTTHKHFDHVQALEAIVSATGAATVAHPVDAPEIPVPTQSPVEDGDAVTVGNRTLRVIHLVGHTPGSIALCYDADGELTDSPHLWTGDCLFPGGPGNTFGDADAFVSLMDGLERKVFDVLPDTTSIYPGHGDDTTIGTERPHLAEWRGRGW
jgi:glyoxylase-like metal-dependent hydrolase (beta-lactamase superfamily II)